MTTGGAAMENKSSTMVVLEAVRDLHALEQLVTRESLQQITGLKLSIIDDRLKHLLQEELVVRMQRGVFVPAEQHTPSRPISHTELPDGTVVLDVGDDVLKLTPGEARTLATMLATRALQASQIEIGNQNVVLNAKLACQVNRLESQVKALMAERRRPVDAVQLDLVV